MPFLAIFLPPNTKKNECRFPIFYDGIGEEKEGKCETSIYPWVSTVHLHHFFFILDPIYGTWEPAKYVKLFSCGFHNVSMCNVFRSNHWKIRSLLKIKSQHIHIISCFIYTKPNDTQWLIHFL